MKKVYILIFIYLSLTRANADSWVQKANVGGTGRAASTGFSIGSKGYISTGYNFSSPPSPRKDFWEYDQLSNTWTQNADFGGTARSGTLSFSIGNKGYLGTGYDNSSVRKDIWEYEPVSNTWTAVANLGGIPRNYSVAFAINGFGYIGTGYNSMSTDYNDFWQFNPVSNTWTQKANVGGGTRSSAVGFAINGKGYIGTGYDTGPMNDFWEYDPITNMWVQKANVGVALRSDAVGFTIGCKGYISIGYINSTPQNDLWEYDPLANTWTQKTSLPGPARSDAMGFSINGKGYIGTGDDISFNQLNDFWEYTPDSNACLTPLPLELLSFTATPVNSSVDIKWTTASETNNNYFSLQRSGNTKDFETLRIIEAADNSAQTLNYTYIDTKPFKGINYYRLEQLDYNGQYSFSNVISINFSTDKINFVIISPNPAEDFIQLTLDNDDNNFEAEIINSYGEAILSTKNKTRIDVSKFPKGIYLIKVKVFENIFTQELIKL